MPDTLTAPPESIDVNAPAPGGPAPTPAPSSANTAPVPMDMSNLPATSNPVQQNPAPQTVQPPAQRPSRLREMAKGALLGLINGGIVGSAEGAVVGAAAPNFTETAYQQNQRQREAATQQAEALPKFTNAQAAHSIAEAAYYNQRVAQMPEELQLQHQQLDEGMARDLIGMGFQPLVFPDTPEGAHAVMMEQTNQKGAVGHYSILHANGQIYAFDLDQMSTQLAAYGPFNQIASIIGAQKVDSVATLKRLPPGVGAKFIDQGDNFFNPKDVTDLNANQKLLLYQGYLRTAQAQGNDYVAGRLKNETLPMLEAEAKVAPQKVAANARARALAGNPKTANIVNPDTGVTETRIVQPGGGGLGPALGAAGTGTQGTRMGQAGLILRSGGQIVQDLQANASQLGTLSAWVQTHGLNTPIADPKLAQLQTELSTFAALQPALHGFRSHSAQEAFMKIIGGIQKNPQATIASINAILNTARNALPPQTGGGAPQATPAAPAQANAAPAAPAGMITVQTSDGKQWHIPQAQLNAARQRDPRLQVIQ